MFARTKHRTVHFDKPFWISGLSEMVTAGDYVVDEDEELIEGLPWAAYRRVATFITLRQQPRTSTECALCRSIQRNSKAS